MRLEKRDESLLSGGCWVEGRNAAPPRKSSGHFSDTSRESRHCVVFPFGLGSSKKFWKKAVGVNWCIEPSNFFFRLWYCMLIFVFTILLLLFISSSPKQLSTAARYLHGQSKGRTRRPEQAQLCPSFIPIPSRQLSSLPVRVKIHSANTNYKSV